VRNGPERQPSPGTITGAPPHPVHRRVTLEPAVHRQRHNGVAIGQRRPHHHHRKLFLAPRLLQSFLTGRLVPRIIPERIRQRRGLGDEVMRERLLVGAGRADKNVLAGAAPEERNALLDFRRV